MTTRKGQVHLALPTRHLMRRVGASYLVMWPASCGASASPWTRGPGSPTQVASSWSIWQ
ncbi:hypothetical protein FKZ61_005860 [Litorilinea aerophila]|uniref:hypothetical protein n=1 Tax=Litorilinea aerophila TaxID=1204385 RepID=UPI0014774EFE|nr:hypothetical protein [Litorilinea aerophila]MCC9075637.1 hypothetical protein [Litorilinea aerophila]